MHQIAPSLSTRILKLDSNWWPQIVCEWYISLHLLNFRLSLNLCGCAPPPQSDEMLSYAHIFVWGGLAVCSCCRRNDTQKHVLFIGTYELVESANPQTFSILFLVSRSLLNAVLLSSKATARRLIVSQQQQRPRQKPTTHHHHVARLL